ncbi:MAG: hypothetical protein DHS20C01_23330 [marine bacterium B5-7]|nr:MAG: hypothetical protein DHS20C01_23330 [marine bacterium B5-7]
MIRFNTRPSLTVPMALCVLFIATTTLAIENDTQVLSADSHSGNMSYVSDFNTEIIPLDARLPWIERFTSAGAFDARFVLGTAQDEINATDDSGEDPTFEKTSGEYDARGVIRDIQKSSGKLKIEHGPIDRHGMPAMTMMFKVADTDLLDQVSKGEQIDFRVEITAEGFIISELMPVGEGQ